MTNGPEDNNSEFDFFEAEQHAAIENLAGRSVFPVIDCERENTYHLIGRVSQHPSSAGLTTASPSPPQQPATAPRAGLRRSATPRTSRHCAT